MLERLARSLAAHLRLTWRARPVRASLWWAATPERWEAFRQIVLGERGLGPEEVDDDRVPC